MENWKGEGRGGVREMTVLLLSVCKWLALSAALGCVVGAVIALFVALLDLASGFTAGFDLYFVFLPLVLFACSLFVRLLAPDASGHGTEKVIEAIHRSNGKMRFAVVPVKLAASVLTIAGGGSAGKEGPSTQIGAGIASTFARALRLRPGDRRILVTAGLAAGFSAVFGAPLAGCVFALEVLVCGKIELNALFPGLIASVASVSMYKLFASLLRLPAYFKFEFALSFEVTTVLWCVLAGLFFGIVAFTFIKSMGLFERLAERIRIWPPLKGLIGGAVLVALTFAFGKQYLGIGGEFAEGLVTGEAALSGTGYIAFLIKIVFTSVTLSFGGSGGIVSPMVFVGASAGWLFGLAAGSPALFAAIGFVAVLAGCANTPIAAVFLAAELFGASLIPYAAVAAVISYLIVGHRSIYPSQIVGASKSCSLVPSGLGGEFAGQRSVGLTPEAESLWQKVFRRKKKEEGEETNGKEE